MMRVPPHLHRPLRPQLRRSSNPRASSGYIVKAKGTAARLVTAGAAVLAARQATSIIPIVFVASDPVGGGFVANLARPGGNATGLSIQAPDFAGKRLELLREIVPGLRRLAIMSHAEYPAAVPGDPGTVSAAC